ncbi:MAG: metal ABC transporter substrate-binding protein [Gemmataceae bacterium]
MKRNQRWRLFVRMFVAIIGMGLLFVNGCTPAHDPWEETEGEGPKVLVSFPALYCFVKNVGGDHVKVRSLCKSVGPHDYGEPSAADVTEAVGADIFLVNGLGLDNWFQAIVSSSGNKKLKVIRIGDLLPEDLGVPQKDGRPDPHAWLGIEPASKMVEIIRDKLIEVAPEHKETYTQNAAEYIKELQKLKEFGTKKFENLEKHPIVPLHDSLKYFRKTFGLKVVKSIKDNRDIGGAGVDEFIQIVEASIESKARVVIFEPGAPKQRANTLKERLEDAYKKQAETLKQDEDEIPKVSLVEFNTIEKVVPGAELTADYYVEAMKANIENLAKGLK